ncbi:titin isoform X2 [Drosophila mauritiana]|uniref:Glycerol-3-phosphate dehydrogenase [NAD(+)] n=1 Tax=Drosophila mauritiana TaxID=7226 RepID=A0A6P8KJK8_DROMA|nr:titin isoform X2 [Drosophila mauritiana]
MAGKLKICIIGAEGWGSAMAAVVSNNVLEGDFDSRVHLYVYDEMIRDTALSEIINTRHENVKYLPGIKLPNNLIAVNDLLEAAQNADILVFSTPLEFVQSYCNILSGNVKESAFAVSMTKGLLSENGEGIELVSHAISESLDIPCYSMMSAHSAMEMAQGKLCEVTIGCSDNSHSKLLIAAMQTNNCRVISVNDVDGVELCGTLTDVVALGAGFIDGLGLGENARLAAVHLGVKEIMRFIKTFFPSSKMSTFYESCGVANAVASSLVDKNVTFAKSLITSGQTIEEIEANLHSGRKLLGPMVASNVNAFLENGLMQHEFPLFTAIHLICQRKAPPELMVEALRNHPDLSNSSISHLLKHEKDDLKMDQGLPELRTALDRILAEAGNENFKQLKVLDDWTEVNDYDVEETYHEKVASRDSCVETKIMPSRLSVQAARLYNDIREGNVGVAFKMDIDEGNRQVRLLLEKEDEMASDAAMTVISSRLSAGQEDDNVRMGHGHITNTSAESDHMASKGIPSGLTTKDSPDVLDLSCESEPLHSSKQNSQQMENAETNFTERLKVNQLKEQIDKQEAANFKAQENLIKSIRQTIQALGDKEKMENLIAKSKMEEDPFQLKSQVEGESSQLKSQVEGESSQLKSQVEGESSQLKSQVEGESLQLKSQVEGESSQLKSQVEGESLQLKSQVEGESSQLKSQVEGESSQLKSQVEGESLQLKSQVEGESSQLKSQVEGESLQVKSQVEGEAYEPRSQTEEEPSQIRSQLDEESAKLKSLMDEDERSLWKSSADKSEFVGYNAEEEQSIEEATDNHQYKLRSDSNKLKKLMFTDSGEPLESEKHIEMKLQDENDFDLDEEPAIGKKDRTYTKENLELEEMLEWQKLKQTDKPHHLYSSAELEDSTTIEGNSRLPIEHDDRFHNVDSYQDRELVQVRAENKEISGAESEEINFISEQRPNQTQDEVNLRPHSDIKSGETGHHEWDWLMNNEKIDSDEKKFYANERMETLSESDQDKLQNLNYQLKEALQHDLDVMSASRSNESNEVLSEEDSNPEAAKKITEQPNNPTPNQIPAVPLPVTMPSKQSHIREGSPQFQNQPKSVPPPSPQTKPQSPKEQQPRRKNAPVEFGNKDEAMDPNVSASDQEVPKHKKISKTEAVIEPVARDVSMAEPNESLHSKKESSPASLSKQESKRKQKRGLRKPSSDSDSVKTTSEFEKQRQIIENQKAQLERMGKKISVMRRGQDRRVSYKGHNPYSSDPDLESRPPMDTSFEKDRTGDYQGLGHQRRKVVVAPPFHPPINPRVRVPRPPFDGRDHEFHTMTTAPVDRHLAPAAKWSSMPSTLKLNRNSLVANIQVKHFAALPSQAMPKPILKMPMGVPRTILCALQLGLLASYLACRKD